MKKLLVNLLIVGMLGFSACVSAASHSQSQIRNMSDVCPDRLEKALTTLVVDPGTYACLSPGLQTAMKNAVGVTSDNSFETWLQTYESATVQACGPIVVYDTKYNVKTYFTSGYSDGHTDIIRVFTRASDGRVVATEVANRFSTAAVYADNPTCTTVLNWPTGDGGFFN